MLRSEFEEYLRHEKGYRERTIQLYLYYFDKFTERHELTQTSIYEFLVTRYRNEIARAFVKAYIKYMNNTFKTSYSVESLLPEPRKQRSRKIPKTLTETEVMKLAKNMNNERDSIGVLLSFYSGLRLAELLGVRIEDFSWQKFSEDKVKAEENNEQKPTCKLTVKNEGAKGGKERVVLVPYDLTFRIHKFIKHNLEPKGYRCLFVTAYETVMKPRTWQTIIDKKSVEVLGKRIHPHTLRHSFATYLLENRIDIKRVSELMGHQDISTTQIYSHISTKDLEESYASVFNE
ncbi:MAG: tyrosine-type recombinase/integrase [Candidatus Pacearchaeota archaeon]